jgi:hypothetical protein
MLVVFNCSAIETEITNTKEFTEKLDERKNQKIQSLNTEMQQKSKSASSRSQAAQSPCTPTALTCLER